MKKIIAVAAAGLLAFGFASGASASNYKFSPSSTRYNGTGPTSATLNGITLPCTGTLTGLTTTLGVGKVKGGSFTGNPGCSSVVFKGLPWTMIAMSPTTVQIRNVDFVTPIGECGPANLTVNLNSGVFTYNGAFDQCSNLQLNLTTTPTLSIVHK